MKTLLITSALILSFSFSCFADKQPVRTKSQNSAEVYNGARLESVEYFPITKRTYELETRRKGSTEGYKVTRDKSGRVKYYKAVLIVK